MIEKPHASTTLGINIEGPYIHAVQLSLVKNRLKLEQIFELELEVPQDDEEHVNPLYIQEAGKQLVEHAEKYLTITTLKTQEVLIRPLELQLKKDKDIDAVLHFQTEPLLPYSIENAMIDRSILAQNSEGSQLTVFASRKDYIEHHLALWESLGLEPEVVSCVPAALASFSKLFSDTEQPLFIVNLGTTETTIVLAVEGKVIAAQAISVGTRMLQQALALDHTEAPLATIDFRSITANHLPTLHGAVENWRMELSRVLSALTKYSKDQTISSILVTGEGASLQNLSDRLCQFLNKTVLFPDSKEGFELPTRQLQRLAIPIGAAVSGFPHWEQINFRQDEFAYPKPWKRIKKPLTIYFSLALALSAAIFFFGQMYIGYQEDQLREEYTQLLQTMNKQPKVFESDYAIKHPDDALIDIDNLKELSPEQIARRMQLLQKEMQDTPETYPLLPNIPRVSDLLAWLSTHPVVSSSKTNEGAFQIDNLQYSLVKRPEIKKKQEKYQVKVEMEFRTASPKLAREFHDALIAPNELVDPKSEVKWSTNRGKYKASFFLKDKTLYPSGGK